VSGEARRYRAGEGIDDLCRACKALRRHSVIVTDGEGRPLRVMCDYCRSEHNYRGGGGEAARQPAPAAARDRGAEAERDRRPVTPETRTEPPMNADAAPGDLERLLRRVLREEGGLTPVAPAERWRGGQLVLRPANPSLQEKAWPIDTFFHKIVMLRNRLRTLEQHVNGSDLPEDQKVRLQAYVTGCYGTLTSFNVLFADEEDQFRGSGGE
jgi:hypothetical protein